MKRPLRTLGFMLAVLLGILACALPGSSGPAPTAPTADQATSASNPISAAPTAVQHQTVPPDALPEQRASHAGDQDSSTTADQKHPPGGDRFTFGQFERPFNANTMDVYYPYLDIQDTIYYLDDTWFYAAITLHDLDQNQSLPGKYAVEIDTDLDGRGDWLLLAEKPSSRTWSTSGVSVWADRNKSVGGQVPVTADKQVSTDDGYESLVFDETHGDDPDLAWARLAPNDPKTVQLAVKRSLLGGDTFLTGAWAGGAILDPSMFDINDHVSHEKAGEAMPDLEYYYPIKDVSQLDNACRVAIGFQPTGSEPGLCPVPKDKTPCPQQYLVCYDFGAQTVCVCAKP